MPRSAAHLVATRFKAGAPSANPHGRPKGSRSKLQELTIAMLHDDFVIHGKEVIERVREKAPQTYLSAVVSLLPKQQQKMESPFVDLTDEELNLLEEHLAAVRAKTVQLIEQHTPREPEPPTLLDLVAQAGKATLP